MKVVSQKLRDSARGQSCTLRLEAHCNHDSATVVLAHLRINHRGMAIKSPDIFAVHACSACHDVLDGRVVGYIEPRDILRALAETQMRWIEDGLLIVVGDSAGRPSKSTARPSKILPRRGL